MAIAFVLAMLSMLSTPAWSQDNVHQSRAALYGFQLSTTQHHELDRWKREDVHWWLSDEREASAEEAVAWFYNYAGRAAYDSPFEDFVRQHGKYFGVEFEKRTDDLIYLAADPEKAPNVVPFAAMAYTWLAAAAPEELEGAFIVGLRGAPEIPEAQHQALIDTWQLEVAALPADLEQRRDHYYDSRGNYIRNLAAAQGGFVQSLSAGDFRYFQLAFLNEDLRTMRETVEAFWDGLPPSVQRSLARTIVSNLRGWKYRWAVHTPDGFEATRLATETEWLALGEVELVQSDGTVLQNVSPPTAEEKTSLRRKAREASLSLSLESLAANRSIHEINRAEKTGNLTEMRGVGVGSGTTIDVGNVLAWTLNPTNKKYLPDVKLHWDFSAMGFAIRMGLRPLVAYASIGKAYVIPDDEYRQQGEWEVVTLNGHPSLEHLLSSNSGTYDAVQMIHGWVNWAVAGISPLEVVFDDVDALTHLVNGTRPLFCSAPANYEGCDHYVGQWRQAMVQPLETSTTGDFIYPGLWFHHKDLGPGAYHAMLKYFTYSYFTVKVTNRSVSASASGGISPGDQGGLSGSLQVSVRPGQVGPLFGPTDLPRWELTIDQLMIDLACSSGYTWKQVGPDQFECVKNSSTTSSCTDHDGDGAGDCEKDPDTPGNGGMDGTDLCSPINPSAECCAQNPGNPACWECRAYVDPSLGGTLGELEEDCTLNADGEIDCVYSTEAVFPYTWVCSFKYDLGYGGGGWSVTDAANDLFCLQYFHCTDWFDKTHEEIVGETTILGKPEACASSGGWYSCPAQHPYMPELYPRMSPTQDLPACTVELLDPSIPTYRWATDCPREGVVVSHDEDVVIENVRPIEPIRADADNEIEFDIRNLGGKLVGNAQYEITIAGIGSYRGWTGTLDAGESRRICVLTSEIGANLSAGTYSVFIRADADNVVPESDETNNTATLQLTVPVASQSTGTDIAVTSGMIHPLLPVSGGPLEYRVTVENRGATGVFGFPIVLKAERGSTIQEESFKVYLQPGESQELVMNVESSVPGSYQLSALANIERLIYENRYDNNEIRRWVEVQDSAEECLPCTTGDPSHVGARLCLDHSDGTAWTGAIWLCSGVRGNGISCDTSGRHPNGWSYAGARCPDPETLEPGWHADACGEPGICPGRDTY